MEQVKAFLFAPEFFDDYESVSEFISDTYLDVNAQKTGEAKNREALFRALLSNNLAQKVTNKKAETILIVTEANLLHFVGYRTDKPELFAQGLLRLDKISTQLLEGDLFLSYHFVKGQCYLHHYIHSERKKYQFDSTKNYINIYKAKKHFSILFNKYLSGELKIDISNTQELILFYSQTLGYLNRYVEAFYLLKKLETISVKFRSGAFLMKYLLFEAFKEKTCNSTSPLLLLHMLELINLSFKDITLDKRNIPILTENKQQIEEILNKYAIENKIDRSHLENLVHEANQEYRKFSSYQKFFVGNYLSLNEHGIYCNCSSTRFDNLKIESSCEHTQIEWILPFQLLLDQLKANFESARCSYFCATKRSKNTTLPILISYYTDENILISKETTELIKAFRECFSILDKIAVGFNDAFSIVSDEKIKKKIYFNSFFKRKDVVNLIDCSENNLYMLALHSMSQDLMSKEESEYAEFYEYKKWRNAAEHEQLIIVKDDANIGLLKKKFPFVEEFVKKTEMENKTLYLLHFCRSAIFTFTWMIRKASIEKHKELLAEAA